MDNDGEPAGGMIVDALITPSTTPGGAMTDTGPAPPDPLSDESGAWETHTSNAADALAAWRAAERRAASLPSGSARRAEADAVVYRFRFAYQVAVDQVRRRSGPG